MHISSILPLAAAIVATSASAFEYNVTGNPYVNASKGILENPGNATITTTGCPDGGNDTIFGVLKNDPHFTILTSLVNGTTNLRCILDNATSTANVTFFAPTDKAFAKSPPLLVQYLTSPGGANSLALLLGYHGAWNTTLNTTWLAQGTTNWTAPTIVGLNVTASPFNLTSNLPSTNGTLGNGTLGNGTLGNGTLTNGTFIGGPSNTTIILVNGETRVSNSSIYATNGAIIPIAGVLSPFQTYSGNNFTNFTITPSPVQNTTNTTTTPLPGTNTTTTAAPTSMTSTVVSTAGTSSASGST